jgi:hypothetical protein
MTAGISDCEYERRGFCATAAGNGCMVRMRWASTWDRGVEKCYLCKPITCEASTDMPSSRVQ